MSKKINSRDHSATHALVWTYSGMAVKMLCQFGIGILIARLLGPEPYGIVAIATVIISLGGLLAEGGISAALVRFQDATARELSGALWVQFAMSSIVALIIVLIAPILVAWLNAPTALNVLRVLALLFPINALASISLALHRRKLNMRPVQLATITSYLLGYGGVGVFLALRGGGVWALVCGQLTQSVLNAIILLASSRPNVRNPVWPKRFIGFGGWTLLGNITSWAHFNLINVFFAKSFGVLTLGNYNRLSLITSTTVPVIGGPLQQVIFPAISRSATDPQRCGRVIEATFRLVGLIFFPAMAIMFFFPDQIVSGIFGEKFTGEAILLRPLALATIGQIWVAVVSPILAGYGQPRAQWVSQFIALPVVVVLLWWLSNFSSLALCWGFCCGIYLRSILVFMAAIRVKAITLNQVINGFLPTTYPAIVSLLACWIGFVLSKNLSPELSMLIACGLAFVGWSGTALMFAHRVLPAAAKLRLDGKLWFTFNI
jgi:PST family polysaccharide transporter